MKKTKSINQTTSTVNVEEALEKFKTYLEKVETLRKDTVDTYLITMRQFFREVKGSNPHEITKAQTLEWKAYCSKYAETCLSTKFSSVNRYMKYLIDTDTNTSQREFRLKARRNQSGKTSKNIEILSRDTVQKIFKVAKENRVRDYAIFRCLYDGALRRKELITLDIKDMNLKDRTLHLRETKNHNDRYPNISGETVTALEEYLKVRVREQPQEGHENALFLNDGRRISRTRLFELFKEYKHRVGLPKDFKFNPHLWRHTACSHFGEELNKSNKNEPEKLKFLQQQTGHTDLKMLMHYLHFNPSKQKKCFDEIFTAREQSLQEQILQEQKPQEPVSPKPKDPRQDRDKLFTMYQQGLITIEEFKDLLEKTAIVKLKP